MTTLPIPVDEATAEAVRQSPDDARTRILDAAAEAVEAALRHERAERVRRAAAALGREAKANGWTEEMNEALLRGDYDDEP